MKKPLENKVLKPKASPDGKTPSGEREPEEKVKIRFKRGYGNPNEVIEVSRAWADYFIRSGIATKEI